jgi:hypothetical protein
MTAPEYRTTLDGGDAIEVHLGYDNDSVIVDWYDVRGDHEFRQEWATVDACCEEMADRQDEEAGAIRRTVAEILMARGVSPESALYSVRHRKPVAPPEPTTPAARWAYKRRERGMETETKRARGVAGFLARAIADVVVYRPTVPNVPPDLLAEYAYWRDLAAHLGKQDEKRAQDGRPAPAPSSAACRDESWGPKDDFRDEGGDPP